MKLPKHPYAISMWDFSPLERRWPGSGWESWERALDELLERGYNALRLDAYPHLLSKKSGTPWELLPVWETVPHGCPIKTTLHLEKDLFSFLTLCKERDIAIGLSTWFREDASAARMAIQSPEDHAEVWLKTLEHFDREGFLEDVFYVDLCNEWPCGWPKFFENEPGQHGNWWTQTSLNWMRRTHQIVQKTHPELPVGYSITHGYERLEEGALGFLGCLEPHIYLAFTGHGESEACLYEESGYEINILNSLRKLEIVRDVLIPKYRSNRERYQFRLQQAIERCAGFSRDQDVPLLTTEGWAVFDFMDCAGMDWSFIQEVGDFAIDTALATGRWVALCTSSFASPGHVGYWRDIAWHQAATQRIRSAQTNHGVTAARNSRGDWPVAFLKSRDRC